jgi:hypothetical protein
MRVQLNGEKQAIDLTLNDHPGERLLVEITPLSADRFDLTFWDKDRNAIEAKLTLEECQRLADALYRITE